MGRKGHWVSALGPIALSILGLLALRFFFPTLVTQGQLSELLHRLGPWAPLAFVAFLAIRPLTLLPGQLLCAIGGLFFGTLWGGIYAMIGSGLCTALIYFATQRQGSRLLARLAGHRYQALVACAKRHDFAFMAAATINPLLPTDLAIAAAASSGARFVPTLLGVLIGTFPGTFLTAQLGSAVGQGKTLLTVFSTLGMGLSLLIGLSLGRKLFKATRFEPRPFPKAPPIRPLEFSFPRE